MISELDPLAMPAMPAGFEELIRPCSCVASHSLTAEG